MSGVKEAPVSIYRSEWNRVNGAVRRMEDFPAQVNARIEAENRRLRGEFGRRMEALHQRQARFEQGLSGLSNEMQAMERRQLARIDALNQRVEQQFEAVGQEMSALDQRMQAGFEAVDREMSALDQRMQAGFEAVDRAVGEVRREVSDLAQRTDDRFRAQRSEYVGLIEAQGRRFERALAEQNEWFTEALTEQREALRGEIDQVAEHIRQREQNERDVAAIWLKDVALLLDNIDKNTRHEKFAPGALARIRSEFTLAEGDHRSGQHQAAIAAAQASYVKAHELQLEVAQKEQEWNLYLTQARRSAAEVLALCDAHEAARWSVETEEGAEEVAAEIDFWSGGRLSALREKVAAENRRLADESESLTLEALKASIEQSVEWMRESEAIAEAARQALIQSQVRQNIAQSVADSFEGTGWEVADSTWQGEDFRGSLHTRFVNPAGDEVVAIVHPETTPEGEIANRLEVNFFDRESDETFRHERIKQIGAYLRQEGIELGEAKTVPGYETGPGDERARDFERVRRQPVEVKSPAKAGG